MSWVDNAVSTTAPFAEGELPPGMPSPTRAVTANRPYRVDRAPALLPVPPGPYRTFADVGSYTEPGADDPKATLRQ